MHSPSPAGPWHEVQRFKAVWLGRWERRGANRQTIVLKRDQPVHRAVPSNRAALTPPEWQKTNRMFGDRTTAGWPRWI